MGTWYLNVYPAVLPLVPQQNILFYKWTWDDGSSECECYMPPVALVSNGIKLNLPQQPLTIQMAGSGSLDTIDLSGFSGNAALSTGGNPSSPFSDGTVPLVTGSQSGHGYWQWSGSLAANTFYNFRVTITINGATYSVDPEMVVKSNPGAGEYPPSQRPG